MERFQAIVCIVFGCCAVFMIGAYTDGTVLYHKHIELYRWVMTGRSRYILLNVWY